MALERDSILVENLRESLNLYQRSLVWAMTASAAFFVLTLTLGDSTVPPVSVLYGRLSGPAAWFIALGLFFVLGILAGSALRNAQAVLAKLRLDQDMTQAVLLYPSLATNPTGFVRIGTVVFPPLTVLIAFAIQLRREFDGTFERGIEWWLGLVLFVVFTAAPYLDIAVRVWHQLGSRSDKPPQLSTRETPKG